MKKSIINSITTFILGLLIILPLSFYCSDTYLSPEAVYNKPDIREYEMTTEEHNKIGIMPLTLVKSTPQGKNVDLNIQLPILTFHNIDPDPNKLNSVTISPSQFMEDMLYVKALGFHTIHLKELLDYTEGKGALPSNPLLITFDDGYRSNYLYAYPILKELNLKAVIFIVGRYVGHSLYKDGKTKINPHFSWTEAEEMYRSGLIDIQSHTYDMHGTGKMAGSPRTGAGKLHNESEEMYKKALKDDFSEVKALIEKNIGNKVIAMAYPYGIYTAESEQVAKDLGFKITLTSKSGINKSLHNLYMLNRISVSNHTTGPELVKQMITSLGRPAVVPFSDLADLNERIRKLQSIISN